MSKKTDALQALRARSRALHREVRRVTGKRAIPIAWHVGTEPAPAARHCFGMRPDTPDQRDHPYLMRVERLPAAVDLSLHCPPVMDQGQLGSCTAHGTLAAFRYDLISRGKPDLQLSRLMQYYDARALEGTTKSDAGAEIRDALKALTKTGVCLEVDWPYQVSKFAAKPPAKCYTAATKHEGLAYQRVSQSLAAIKSALAGGLPVVIGISVYESFESDAVAKTGTVPMPTKTEQLLGGHCVYCTGYDDKTQRFRCRNSWGTAWAMHGDFTLPYSYLTNPDLCSDLWVLSSVTG